MRKLAELWLTDDNDYHLRVTVGAFQRQLTADPERAEQYAQFEVIEVMRTLVAAYDANNMEHGADPAPERD